jgi:uncharacterized protein YkwD
MALAQRRKHARGLLLLVAAALSVSTSLSPVRASNPAGPSASPCAAVPLPTASSTLAGHPYLSLAFNALSHDRARFAGLGPLKRSAALSAVAEAHSQYMASIGSWSDGDPDGWILARVRAAGVDATYAGQNVVTSNGGTVAQAVQNGEAFFGREAGGGGPHWENITNPNHHYVGMGIALLGGPGNYTIYLTQVFADAGGCSAPAADSFSTASATSAGPRVGSTMHPAVDALQLRSEPGGMVIQTLSGSDRLKIVSVHGNWAQVDVLSSQVYGWVYAPMLAQLT